MPELPEKLNKIEIENELKNLEGDLTRDNLDENIKLYEFLKNEGKDLSKQRAEQKIKDIERIKELKAQLDIIKEEPGQDVKTQDTGTNLTEEKPNNKEVSAEEKKVLTVENKSEKEEGQEIKTYSVDFIKSKVLSLIGGIKEIGSVEKFDIVCLEKNITINTTVTSWGFDINVKIEIENEDNGIVIKKYNIDAKWPAKGKAEKALVPRLGEISEMLKNYIEKEEGKKVEKIWIEDGMLKVDFKKEITDESKNEESDKKVDDIPENQTENTEVAANFYENKDLDVLNDLTEHYNKIINDPLVEKNNSEHATRQLALIEEEKKRRGGVENPTTEEPPEKEVINPATETTEPVLEDTKSDTPEPQQTGDINTPTQESPEKTEIKDYTNDFEWSAGHNYEERGVYKLLIDGNQMAVKVEEVRAKFKERSIFSRMISNKEKLEKDEYWKVNCGIVGEFEEFTKKGVTKELLNEDKTFFEPKEFKTKKEAMDKANEIINSIIKKSEKIIKKITPEFDEFKKKETEYYLQEDNDKLMGPFKKRMLDLLNNNPIGFLDHSIIYYKKTIKEAIDKKEKPSWWDIQQKEKYQKMKNDLLELNGFKNIESISDEQK